MMLLRALEMRVKGFDRLLAETKCTERAAAKTNDSAWSYVQHHMTAREVAVTMIVSHGNDPEAAEMAPGVVGGAHVLT
jgi:predicted phage tail protein